MGNASPKVILLTACLLNEDLECDGRAIFTLLRTYSVMLWKLCEDSLGKTFDSICCISAYLLFLIPWAVLREYCQSQFLNQRLWHFCSSNMQFLTVPGSQCVYIRCIMRLTKMLELHTIIQSFRSYISHVVQLFWTFLVWLNGVNITEDLWLVNTSDTLPGTTHFSSHAGINASFDDIVVHGDLKVGGRIDGRNLSQIFDQRVTLSSNQTIESHLIFNDYVCATGIELLCVFF